MSKKGEITTNKARNVPVNPLGHEAVVERTADLQRELQSQVLQDGEKVPIDDKSELIIGGAGASETVRDGNLSELPQELQLQLTKIGKTLRTHGVTGGRDV